MSCKIRDGPRYKNLWGFLFWAHCFPALHCFEFLVVLLRLCFTSLQVFTLRTSRSVTVPQLAIVKAPGGDNCKCWTKTRFGALLPDSSPIISWEKIAGHGAWGWWEGGKKTESLFFLLRVRLVDLIPELRKYSEVLQNSCCLLLLKGRLLRYKKRFFKTFCSLQYCQHKKQKKKNMKIFFLHIFTYFTSLFYYIISTYVNFYLLFAW